MNVHLSHATPPPAAFSIYYMLWALAGCRCPRKSLSKSQPHGASQKSQWQIGKKTRFNMIQSIFHDISFIFSLFHENCFKLCLESFHLSMDHGCTQQQCPQHHKELEPKLQMARSSRGLFTLTEGVDLQRPSADVSSRP